MKLIGSHIVCRRHLVMYGPWPCSTGRPRQGVDVCGELYVREHAAVPHNDKGCGVHSVAGHDVLGPDGGISHVGGLAVVANLRHPDSYEADTRWSTTKPCTRESCCPEVLCYYPSSYTSAQCFRKPCKRASCCPQVLCYYPSSYTSVQCLRKPCKRESFCPQALCYSPGSYTSAQYLRNFCLTAITNLLHSFPNNAIVFLVYPNRAQELTAERQEC